MGYRRINDNIGHCGPIWFKFICLIRAEHKNMGYRRKNDNIGHCGPIWLRNDPKTQQGSCSSSDTIKSSGERSQKVEWKTLQGCSLKRYVMSVWSCVNGHFTAKRWVFFWLFCRHTFSDNHGVTSGRPNRRFDKIGDSGVKQVILKYCRCTTYCSTSHRRER